MKVCVAGLWHLGSVTSACLASLGHRVLGVDVDEAVITKLASGEPPVLEPGLKELIEQGLSSGALAFATSLPEALEIDILWIAYDTPVDDADIADSESVVSETKRLLSALPSKAIVAVSSQLPVGTIRRLQEFASTRYPGKQIDVVSIPENLRLGQALDSFLRPDRIVVGVSSSFDRTRLGEFLHSITPNIEWMSIESAEMTKHAINAFLATSVTFANEIASLCEVVGADAKEVERGLKTESRIGRKAYLSPGAAFAGGTLARDVEFLSATARSKFVSAKLIGAIAASNDAHKLWVRRKLTALFTELKGVRFAIWGLTYKRGTDTLRRSPAVELCDWLLEREAIVGVHDPVVKALPERWSGKVMRYDDAHAVTENSRALIVATEWPLYREIAGPLLPRLAGRTVVIDPNRFLFELARKCDGLDYFTVGAPASFGSKP